MRSAKNVTNVGQEGGAARSPLLASAKPRWGPIRGREWTIVIVSGLVALLFLFSYLAQPMPHVAGSNPPPLSSAVTVSNLQSTLVGPHHWYNTTVLALTISPQLGQLNFLVRNASGSGPLALPWIISVLLPGARQPSATYDIAGADWTSGSMLNLAVGDVLSTDVGLATVAGYSLVIGATGVNFGGTINLTLD